ncbi:P-loop containing nucleoside triphosphate hydrolase protein [Laetiporus sulphureus 93-53]|uniref:p-loop containing nucleoside triphosphate hydrolase protein n=1 Tax=Laetiporus sulphureus 93-53 TaxID=1314785 RepID=A0A165B5Z1_9APHY|nr:P-loop containing nucleoside triphosphate hydrolase protein [Laetiporus sulphureus 93-53]KZT00315.1 P-loop containing nucleoside triphosphate hydrolase protein [Laetiporus sulphureus 93-53]
MAPTEKMATSGKTKSYSQPILKRVKGENLYCDAKAAARLKIHSHIIETEPFQDMFWAKAQCKKARIGMGTFEELSKLSAAAAEKAEAAGNAVEESAASADFQIHADVVEPIYTAKGTSHHIYGERYKVIDSSDVILHILDTRDPMGMLCKSVLVYIRGEKVHKQVVLVINKCELVSNWVTLLHQFSQLHSDKKQISMGFIGSPNLGKSSIINTLKSRKVRTVAPRIYLIDCPGIVLTSVKDFSISIVLKGVVRIEVLTTPSKRIPTLMERVKPICLSRMYLSELLDPSKGWASEAFMDKLAQMKGRLLKKGEPDMEAVVKILLSDWWLEELNEKEEKAWKRAEKTGAVDAKGKVKQHLGSIMQKNMFVGEDDHAEAEEEDAEQSEDDAVEGEDASESEQNAEFESEQQPKKETRMKMNKRKSTNFYSMANVKNKNREKALLMKSLRAGGKDGCKGHKKT